MDDFIRINIDGRIYGVNKFNPLEGMEYGTAILAVISPALGGIFEASKEGGDPIKIAAEFAGALKDPSVTPLLHRALKQCFTPENESLSDEVVFNRHFKKYPGDLFVLGVRAAYTLVKDFFPSQLATIASDFQTRLNPVSPSTE